MVKVEERFESEFFFLKRPREKKRKETTLSRFHPTHRRRWVTVGEARGDVVPRVDAVDGPGTELLHFFFFLTFGGRGRFFFFFFRLLSLSLSLSLARARALSRPFHLSPGR